jgi:mRNA-degrading endonuclease YafQ of YafQ-DinJ toxin-antitoxin module
MAASLEATLEQLSADAMHPSLRTHKLRGPLAGCWACSASYDLRVVFEYVQHDEAEAILLLALGTHDQVY